MNGIRLSGVFEITELDATSVNDIRNGNDDQNFENKIEEKDTQYFDVDKWVYKKL